MPRCVTDDGGQTAIRAGEEIVVVAADLGRGLHEHRDLELRMLRQLLRQQRELELARLLQLAALALVLGLQQSLLDLLLLASTLLFEQPPLVVVELLGHAIERPGQLTELVAGAQHHPRPELARRQSLGALGQQPEIASHPVGQP